MPTWSRSSVPGVRGGSSSASSRRASTASAASSSTDAVAARAETLRARTMAAELGLPIEACRTLSGGASRRRRSCSRRPGPGRLFLDRGNVAAGTHVTTLGPDEPGKAEVAAEVIATALFVCDDRALAVEMGALAGSGSAPRPSAPSSARSSPAVTRAAPSDREITVYGGVGLAFQDAVAAVTVYDAARAPGATVGRSTSSARRRPKTASRLRPGRVRVSFPLRESRGSQRVEPAPRIRASDDARRHARPESGTHPATRR